MKRITSILLVLAGLSLSAQQHLNEPAIAAEELSPGEKANLAREMEQKKLQRQRATFAKTSGLVSQRMSHSDIGFDQFSATLRTVYSPFAPDSTYIQNFTGPDNINTHGFGQTFDPTSIGFSYLGQQFFTEKDGYTIDTIYVGVRYRTAALTTGFTGDTLQVVAFSGDSVNNQVWRVGIGYPANTYPNQPNRINVLPPRYTGNPAIGTQGTINASNKLIMKYALKDSDTTINYLKVVPPSPINVAPGEKFGVFCTFIPGYTYDPSTQTYYISGGSGDVNNMSWLYHTRQNSTDNYPYFFEALLQGDGSKGLSNTLFSDTRYNSWTGSDAFRNEYVGPTTLRGNLIDFWVSGISTVGVNETSISNGLNVYPNPGAGPVEIAIPSGGEFTLQIMDMMGKVVHSEKFQLNGEGSITRDFSGYSQGVYLVNLSDGKSTRATRLVIQ